MILFLYSYCSQSYMSMCRSFTATVCVSAHAARRKCLVILKKPNSLPCCEVQLSLINSLLTINRVSWLKITDISRTISVPIIRKCCDIDIKLERDEGD
jgi:hypothetical protein